MTLEAKAIAYLVAVVAIFCAGWIVKGWQVDSVELAIAKTRQEAQIGAAEAIAKIEVKNTTVYQKATTKVIEQPVYKECQHDQQMLDNINKALAQ